MTVINNFSSLLSFLSTCNKIGTDWLFSSASYIGNCKPTSLSLLTVFTACPVRGIEVTSVVETNGDICTYVAILYNLIPWNPTSTFVVSHRVKSVEKNFGSFDELINIVLQNATSSHGSNQCSILFHIHFNQLEV